MRQAYRVEIDKEGCTKCGAGKIWVIIGPGEMGTGVGYGAEEEADDVAEDLNLAFEEGKKAASAGAPKHG